MRMTVMFIINIVKLIIRKLNDNFCAFALVMNTRNYNFKGKNKVTSIALLPIIFLFASGRLEIATFKNI